MVTIDLVALLAAVRRVRANPGAPVAPTGDTAMDQALAALAIRQLQGTTLPYWMLVGAAANPEKPDRQQGR